MTISLGYRALDVGRSRAFALIDQLSVHEPIDWLCKVFEVNRSCYYAQRLRRRTPDIERLRLRSRVSELFSQSRSAAGSRSILSLMRDDGEQLGRFKVRSLMRELDLVSKQSGSHAYKRATVERLDIPNILNRDVRCPGTQPGLVRRHHLHLGTGEMALPGCRAGSSYAPGGGLGAVGKARRCW